MNKKVGILTFHRSHNYGAFMQCYALTNVLKDELKCDVEVIDYNSRKSRKYYIKDIFRDRKLSSILFNIKKYNMFNREVNNLKLSKNKLFSDNLSKIKKFIENNKYDCIITGSDEIWKVDGVRGFPNAYWLPDIECCKKVSYAASSRNEYEVLTDNTKKQIRHYLNSYNEISVRDNITKKMIEKIIDKKVDLVCDPTLAYDFRFDKEYGKKILVEKFKINPEKKCIGIMVNKENIANIIKKKYGKEYEVISLYFDYKNIKSYPKLTPFEWIQVIGALDCFITTFFHGMCFAINSNVPFLIIEQRNIKNESYSKSYDLLSRNNFKKNYYQSNSGANLEERIEQFIFDCKSNNYECDYSLIKNSEKNLFYNFVSKIKKVISEDK